MPITWDDLTVSFEGFDRESLIDEWKWLIGSALPILITSVGDAFVQDESGKIFWLITGSAELEEVAESYEEFKRKLQDNELVHDWFLVPVVARLKEAGSKLKSGQVYSFKLLPILGGKYEPENFEPTDLSVHFAVSGQMNFKVKDLPDGAQVTFEVTD